MAEWVTLGPEMRQARERLGLSRAAVSRQIPVVEKTYERWEKRGQVPRPFLPTVARLLDLEIEEPDRTRIELDGRPDTSIGESERTAIAESIDDLAQAVLLLRDEQSRQADEQNRQADEIAELRQQIERLPRKATANGER